MSATPVVAARERPLWRTVAVPTEHGGWGLTLEPVLLGLLVARSVGGVALGIAALGAFIVRTPLKLALVDRHRDRWLARSALAMKVAAGELGLIVAMAGVALATSGWRWLVPVVVAAPLVGVEAWFDARSRGRRLVPELCGAVGIGAVAAAIVVAAGGGAGLAAGVWLLLAARAVAAVPFVRVQILRLRHGVAVTRSSDGAQVAALAVGGLAVLADRRLFAGFGALVALLLLHLVWVRRPPVVAKVLGLRQMALGIGLVAVAATGVLAS